MEKKKKDLTQPIEKLEWVVDLLYDGRRLDKFVCHKRRWRSRNTVQERIRAGDVLVNGQPGRPNTRLKKGDIVTVKLDVAPEDLSQIKLDVIYEDDYLVALNKQPGILVHPAGKKLFGTLINALHARYRGEPSVTPQLCHRLDEFTSGVLLVAKDANTRRYVQHEFESGGVKKSYLAIVEGDLEDERGVVEASVGMLRGDAPDNRVRMAAGVPWGRESSTEYEVEERFGDFTLVRCLPRTGRTHQIRVHMAYIKHPVACDETYTGRGKLTLADLGIEVEDVLLERQALHSASLKFVHPVTQESLTIEAGLAEDMNGVLELLRGRTGRKTERTG